MKVFLISVFCCVFFLTGRAQTAAKFLPNSLCYRLWWLDNKLGGYDGYEFRKNGEVKLLNYEVFTGEKWWIKGDHLFVEIRSRESGKVLKTDYLIKNQSQDLLVLNYTMLGEPFTDTYEALKNDDFTDKLTGQWDGENGSYLQIVPMNGFQFQLVLCVTNNGPIERAEGYLEKENERLIFYPEEEGKEMTLYVESGQETISFGGKPYSRKCKEK